MKYIKKIGILLAIMVLITQPWINELMQTCVKAIRPLYGIAGAILAIYIVLLLSLLGSKRAEDKMPAHKRGTPGWRLAQQRRNATLLAHFGSEAALHDWFASIGQIGGRNSNTGGFKKDIACDCDMYSTTHFIRECAGVKGGRISRRGKAIEKADK